jgi:hypothetical protein
MQTQDLVTMSPHNNFGYTLKEKERKTQYPHQLDKFLSYLELEGTRVDIDCLIDDTNIRPIKKRT